MKSKSIFALLIFLFINSSFISGQTETEEEVIYKVVGQMPRFPGCEEETLFLNEIEQCAKEKMLTYIYKNLVYPKIAKDNGVEGMAVIQFKVNTNGDIIDAKIKRDPGAGTGKEALRIVNSMNDMDEKWIPGRQDGKLVKVQYTLPIKFKLEDKIGRFRKKSNRGEVGNRIVSSKGLTKKPIFPDCNNPFEKNCTEKAFRAFIELNQLYPEEAIKNGWEDEVLVQFVIETDGSVSMAKALEYEHQILAKDAIDIINWMNEEEMRWSPGEAGYRPVRSYYEVKVVYDIEEWNERNR